MLQIQTPEIRLNTWYEDERGIKSACIIIARFNYLLLVRKDVEDVIIKSFYFYETFDQAVRFLHLLLGLDCRRIKFTSQAIEERTF